MLHGMELPNAHPRAPAPASAPLSGILTKTGVFGTHSYRDQGSGMTWPGEWCFKSWERDHGAGEQYHVFSIDPNVPLACSSMSQITISPYAMQCLVGRGKTAIGANRTAYENHP